MCDTVAAIVSPEHSFFGKNSDRDPEEFQFVYISTDPAREFRERPVQYEKKEYLEKSFPLLREIFPHYQHPYSALLSKPDWIWGAEMGVNEKGLAIGNEAVFYRGAKRVEGLLGMDILRLALHNCRDVQEAVGFITGLIEKYPQGGNGSFTGKLYYHNSFIIKDFKEAVVLETGGDTWALKEVADYATISNAYSIRDDFQQCSKEGPGNLKKDLEDRLFTFFSRGDLRQKLSSTYLAEKEVNLRNLFGLFRLHKNNSLQPERGMTSICIHPGIFIKSETTSSLVIEYFQDRFLAWFTASPNPCLSLYKPLLFQEEVLEENPFIDLEYAYLYSKKWRQLSHQLGKKAAYFHSRLAGERDRVEEEMEKKMAPFLRGEEDGQEVWLESLEMAEKYLNKIESSSR